MKQSGQIIYFILFLLCSFSGYSQIKKLPSGVIVKSTGPGEPSLAPVPKQDSPRYKLRYEVPDSITSFVLYNKEYINGEHIPDLFDFVESWSHLEKGDVVFFEMIPEFTSISNLRVFLNFPRFSRMIYMNLSDDEKLLKTVRFNSAGKERKDTFVPIFLMYEDNKKGEVEDIVNKYVIDGFIPVKEDTNKELLSKLPRYKLIYYDIVF